MEIVQPIPTRAKIARAWLEHAHSFDRCVVFSRTQKSRSSLHIVSYMAKKQNGGKVIEVLKIYRVIFQLFRDFN